MESSNILLNPWVVSIGTGLILYLIFEVVKGRREPTVPYLQAVEVLFHNKDSEWIRFDHFIANLGRGIAIDVETYTQIEINGHIEFQSPITASSAIPPGQKLRVRSQDPYELVRYCQTPNQDSKYIFIVEYSDSSKNRFRVSKSFYYHPEQKLLSTRKENIPKKITR